MEFVDYLPLRHTLTVTAIGEICLVAQGTHICRIQYADTLNVDDPTLGIWVTPFDPVFSIAIAQIDEYLEGKRKAFTFSYRLEDKGFATRVWQETQHIPYGAQITYAELALILGNSKRVRAVSNALQANPLLFVVPCHRVKASQTLGSYQGGSERKRFLLGIEARNSDTPAQLF